MPTATDFPRYVVLVTYKNGGTSLFGDYRGAPFLTLLEAEDYSRRCNSDKEYVRSATVRMIHHS